MHYSKHPLNSISSNSEDTVIINQDYTPVNYQIFLKTPLIKRIKELIGEKVYPLKNWIEKKQTLNKLNIDFIIVSRTKTNDTITYDELNENIISEHLLIVNTTPLGMFPNIKNYPDLPYQHISEKHLLYDLIYNPAETQFLRLGKLNNATVMNGEKMLHLQAEEAWKIWND